MRDHITAAVTKAEGYLELGMAEEAWETLEDLPTDAKNHADVLALRVSILSREGMAKAHVLR
jgi:hypothetical protein